MKNRNKLSTELRRTLTAIVRGIGLVKQAAGRWTALWILLLLVQGMLPAAQVYLLKIAVNLLSPSVVAPSVIASFFSKGWPVFTLIPALWIAGQVAASLMIWVRTIQSELVQDYIHTLIHGKALELDLAFFDTPASYDLMHRARVDAMSQPLVMLESLGLLIQNSITLFALSLMLATYTIWLPLLLLAAALPALWVVGQHIIREHHWRMANTANERRARYYDTLLTDQTTAAEVRLFDLGNRFRSTFREIRGKLREGRFDLSKKEMKAEMVAGGLSLSGGVIGVAWMLFKVINGVARLGDLVLCYQSFMQGQSLMRSLFESAGRLYRSSLFLENLFEFLKVESKVPAPLIPETVPSQLHEGIHFEKVSFRYPGSEHDALVDFTMFLPAGTVTAIVGYNGAGKSTLSKLLCRFYDPTAGKITVDHKDLRNFAVDDIRRRISILFQQPLNFHTTASENIAFGDCSAPPDMFRIEGAAKAAGADGPIRRLPKSYETVLGKWFGGAELSVGEWQRLALARTFFRDAQIVILDEPTSAMDSWAEQEWMRRFREMTRGKTVLIITHRFTSAMHADMIHVMESGAIIESGTHNELVAFGGQYAESWNAQIEEIASPFGEQ